MIAAGVGLVSANALPAQNAAAVLTAAEVIAHESPFYSHQGALDQLNKSLETEEWYWRK